MMRPAKAGRQEVPLGSGNSTPGDLPHHDHADAGATRPPSVILHSDDEDDMSVGDAEVWRGDREDDWRKCRTALKRLGRDGRKLELWNHWLYPSHPASSLDGEKGKGKPAQEDVPSSRSSLIRDDTLAEEAGTKIDKGPREHIAAVLRAHVCSFQIIPSQSFSAMFCFMIGYSNHADVRLPRVSGSVR